MQNRPRHQGLRRGRRAAGSGSTIAGAGAVCAGNTIEGAGAVCSGVSTITGVAAAGAADDGATGTTMIGAVVEPEAGGSAGMVPTVVVPAGTVTAGSSGLV